MLDNLPRASITLNQFFSCIDIVSPNLQPELRDMNCIGFIASSADVHKIMEYADAVSKLLKVRAFSGYVRDVFN